MDKTYWQQEIEDAESGNANDHFYDNVRSLTEIMGYLLDIIEKVDALEEIDEDNNNKIMWYYESMGEKPVLKTVCNCLPATLLNHGCICKGKGQKNP